MPTNVDNQHALRDGGHGKTVPTLHDYTKVDKVLSGHQNVVGWMESGGIKTGEMETGGMKTDGHDWTVPILHEQMIQITSTGDSHEI